MTQPTSTPAADREAARRDAELAALEAAVVAVVTGTLAARLGRAVRVLRDGFGRPGWLLVRRAVARDLARVNPGVAAQVARMLPRAARLGARHAGAPLPAGHDVRDDPETARLLDAADGRVVGKLTTAAGVVRDRVDTPSQLDHAAARVDAAGSEARTVAGDLVARAAAVGTRVAAEAAGQQVVIEAEATACLSCASMAGSTPDEDGLFRPVRVYTARLIPWLRDGVASVPLHGGCRCRIVVVTPGLVGRLRRKAQQDVAAARSGYDSRAEQLRAVEGLLSRRSTTASARRRAAQTRARGRSSPRDPRGRQQAG